MSTESRPDNMGKLGTVLGLFMFVTFTCYAVIDDFEEPQVAFKKAVQDRKSDIECEDYVNGTNVKSKEVIKYEKIYFVDGTKFLLSVSTGKQYKTTQCVLLN